jgi:endogenous inhibitor of DNA gyrase (YacG/DUF329 family)
MRCPICKREFDPATSTTVPFCGERCRTIDLGRWLGEDYGVPVQPDPDSEEESGADSRDGHPAPDESS